MSSGNTTSDSPQRIVARYFLLSLIAKGLLLIACIPLAGIAAEYAQTASKMKLDMFILLVSIFLLSLAYGGVSLGVGLLCQKRLGSSGPTHAMAWREARMAACLLCMFLLFASMDFTAELVVIVLVGALVGVGLAFLNNRAPASPPPLPADSAALSPLEEFIRVHSKSKVWLRIRADDEVHANCRPTRNGSIIFLSRGLLRRLCPAEQVAVVAHELGHHLRKDFSASIGCVILGYAARLVAAFVVLRSMAGNPPSPTAAIAALPIAALAVWLTGILARIAHVHLIFRMETIATRWAVAATADPAAYESAIQKVKEAKGEADEPFWFERLLFTTHPSLRDVQALTQGFRRAHPETTQRVSNRMEENRGSEK